MIWYTKEDFPKLESSVKLYDDMGNYMYNIMNCQALHGLGSGRFVLRIGEKNAVMQNRHYYS